MKPPRQRGCSLWTLTGCGCGLCGMLGILFVFFALGVQLMRERQHPEWNRNDYAVCQTRLRYLYRSLESYRRDHGSLPATLDDLSAHHLDSPDRLRCPREVNDAGTPYRYTPSPSGPEDPLIVCTNHGQGDLILLHNGLIRYGNPTDHR